MINIQLHSAGNFHRKIGFLPWTMGQDSCHFFVIGRMNVLVNGVTRQFHLFSRVTLRPLDVA